MSALSPAEEVLAPIHQAAPANADERPGSCMDCSRLRATWPIDVVVPDDQWRQIAGRDDGGGILCPECLLARAARLPGVKIAKFTFAAQYESRRERRERERAESKRSRAERLEAQQLCTHGNQLGWCDLCVEDHEQQGPS